MESIKQQVLDYLLSGKTLTVQKALKLFHTTELRMIVSRLRKEGYPIETERRIDTDTDKWYNDYFMNMN